MTKENKNSTAINPEGGGGKALMASLREELFFAASLRDYYKGTRFAL